MNNKKRRIMKHKYLFLAATMALMLSGCANDDSSNEAQSNGKGHESSVQGLAEFTTDIVNRPTTRTSMEHSIKGGGKFFWENSDKIHVIDDNGADQTSKVLSLTEKAASAKFYVPGKFDGDNYKVYYTGANGTSYNRVTIAANQSQSTPNSTTHFGVAGDCGTGTATREDDRFKFRIDHKAAYLCLLPYITNAELGKNVYLKKIEISSNKTLAGTYDFDYNGLKSGSVTNSSMTVTLKTGSGNGLRLDYTKPDILNSYYVVIAPGKYILSIKFWIYDPVTKVEGAVTKNLKLIDFKVNTVTDIKADLTVHDYPANKYYMWDPSGEQYHCWSNAANYPKVNGEVGTSYANHNGGGVWYNNSIGDGTQPVRATRYFWNCPNVNEIYWYVEYGDPYWDTSLWSTMGHLYAGGIWLKRIHVIAVGHGGTSETNRKGPDGKDHTQGTDSWTHLTVSRHYTKKGRPSASEIANYFYLPALCGYEPVKGVHRQGRLYGMGRIGAYWTKTSTPNAKPDAYRFSFDKDSVHVNSSRRSYAFHRWVADDDSYKLTK